jgi:glycine/D-amino acid oxidase-like deaminating enzyme
MEPQLEVSDYAALVHDPDAGYADPIATAHGFAAAAVVEGAKVFDEHTVSSISTRRGTVVGVKIRGAGLLSAERVVIAAGNWTRDLAATVAPRLPVRYVRGEVAILRRPVDFGAPPRIHFDFYGNTYSRPEGEKDTLAGYMNTDPRKTMPRHEFAESLPAATVRDLRTRLAKRFPRMKDAQPRGGWAGAYDVTPDSYPILDRIGPDGLFVAVGFSSPSMWPRESGPSRWCRSARRGSRRSDSSAPMHRSQPGRGGGSPRTRAASFDTFADRLVDIISSKAALRTPGCTRSSAWAMSTRA